MTAEFYKNVYQKNDFIKILGNKEVLEKSQIRLEMNASSQSPF